MLSQRLVMPQRQQTWKIALIVLLLIVFTAVLTITSPGGADYEASFYPAAREVFAVRNPYNIHSFLTPPWTLIPVLPLALLPYHLGRALFAILNLVALGWVLHRLQAKPIAAIAYLLSPPVLQCLLNANIEWMPLIGLTLPPRYGLFFVLAKPQTGWVVALFWLVDAWREGGLKQVIATFAPLTIVTLLSFLFFGFWPLEFLTAGDSTWQANWNASLFPLTIPVGLALIVYALRTRQINAAFAAGPCLSPYLMMHGWGNVLVSLFQRNAEMVAAVVGWWAIVVIQATGIGL
jgi:hypothetical protein